MLSARILNTLRFFDLQECPLTLLELHKFLVPTWEQMKGFLDVKWEYLDEYNEKRPVERVGLEKILQVLEDELNEEVESLQGYYCLKGRSQIIQSRLQNYFFGLVREKLIRRFIPPIKYIPFVRGVGLLGSQALGQQKPGSDIDLLIIVDPKFLWLARFLVSTYFQLIGLRRHGEKVANRFCLNHYLIENTILNQDRNLYTASEYLKMRPLINSQNLQKFLKLNQFWISRFFPNTQIGNLGEKNTQSFLQKIGERILNVKLGLWIQGLTKKLQLGRINHEEFIIVSDAELSFHPNNRKLNLFERFFELQK